MYGGGGTPNAAEEKDSREIRIFEERKEGLNFRLPRSIVFGGPLETWPERGREMECNTVILDFDVL